MPINPIGPVPPSKGTNETPDQIWQDILSDKNAIISEIANQSAFAIDRITLLADNLTSLMNSPSATAAQKQTAQKAMMRLFGTDDIYSTTPFNSDSSNMPLITSLLPGPGSPADLTQGSYMEQFMSGTDSQREHAFYFCTENWTQQNFDDTSIGWKNTLDQLGIK